MTKEDSPKTRNSKVLWWVLIGGGITAFLLLAFTIIAVVWFDVFNLQNQRPAFLNATVLISGSIIGLVAVIVNVWRNDRDEERSQREQAALQLQLDTAERTAKIEGERVRREQAESFAKRYSQSLDHLVKTNSTTERLGGLYQLEALALENDAPLNTHVTDLLLSSLTEEIQANPSEGYRGMLLSRDNPSLDRPKIDPAPFQTHTFEVVMRTLSGLSRQELQDRTHGDHIQMSRLNAYGSNLNQVRVDRLDLSRACLASSSFRDVSLSNTLLTNAILEYTSFSGSDSALISCEMEFTYLYGIHVNGIVIKDVEVSRSSMANAHFDECKVQDFTVHKCYGEMMQFQNCHLLQAKFSESQINEATFTGSTFDTVTVDNCKCRNARFTGLKITDAKFINGTDLTYATFTGSDLSKTTFKDVILTGTSFAGALNADRATFHDVRWQSNTPPRGLPSTVLAALQKNKHYSPQVPNAGN